MADAVRHHAAVVLAAGAASRMGGPKQSLPFAGEPLVRRAARMALDAASAPVVVVAGAYEDDVRAAVATLPVHVVTNARWRDGIGTSIQAGLEALRDVDVCGAILMLADQPLVTSAVLRRLVGGHHGSGQPIVAARYAGTVGVPAFFAREAFAWLEALPPSGGCKRVILSRTDAALLLDCPEAALDVDTPADYDRIVGQSGGFP